MSEPAGVDEYLAALPAAQRETLGLIRETIRAALPQPTELISYRMPAFRARGRIVVWYAAFSDHYSIFPWSQAMRAALGADIEPHISGKGTIRFAAGEPPPLDLIRRIVEFRLGEIAAARRTDTAKS